MNEHPLSDVSDLVGSEVRRYRELRKLTVDEVAARCAAVGAPHLTVPSLYALESGRREKGTGRRRRLVSVDEVLVLAHVLDVSPVVLLVPPHIPDDLAYRLTPSLAAPAATVRKWLRGELPAAPRMFEPAEDRSHLAMHSTDVQQVFRDPALLAELARAVRALDEKGADDA